MSQKVNRRTALKAVVVAGTGLTLGFGWTWVTRRDENHAGSLHSHSVQPNLWLRIAEDDSVTVYVAKSEMGQGVHTAIPMLVAEELGVDWKRVRIEQAPVNPLYGIQSTSGSSSIRTSWEPLRQAGAFARDMLISAAAQWWSVPKHECRADDGGWVLHETSGRRLRYGELASAAAKQPLPESVVLKIPAEFSIIGKPIRRLDTPTKTDGSAIYGLDVRLPGLLIATIIHPPAFGARPGKIDATAAERIPGVRAIVPVDSGIVVVANCYWSAKKGLDALQIEWLPPTAHSPINSADLRNLFRSLAEQQGVIAAKVGDIEVGLRQAAQRIEAVYELPFLAHATMEPMCCIAHVHDGQCEVWAPTQSPSGAQQVAAEQAFSVVGLGYRKLWRHVTGDYSDFVKVHPTLLGGGFGRRLQQDYVAEAIQIAKAVQVPVKLIWSRQEDIQHDYYRPASYNVVRGGIDHNGLPIAWSHRIVSPSIRDYRGDPEVAQSGLDNSSVEGAELPYAIPHCQVDYVMARTPVPIGLWRSVAHSLNAFVVECFMDELAVLGGHDACELRLKLLANQPRHRQVLKLAAEKAGWGKPRADGHHLGVAIHASFGSYVAQVAEISVTPEGKIQVHRVTCAIDCGQVVNPNILAAQMEGAVIFGLTAALKGEITFDRGRVQQSNFHDYPLLRMDEMPVVETVIVNSTAPPMGVGEPGVPPIAPAVANAVYAATGVRVRRLPIRTEDLIAAR